MIEKLPVVLYCWIRFGVNIRTPPLLLPLAVSALLRVIDGDFARLSFRDTKLSFI